MAETVRITVEVEVTPDVDSSAFQIASGVVLEALHECSLFPSRLTIETVENGSTHGAST